MATVTITIPDAQVARYIEAFTVPFGLPQTGNAARNRLIELCKMYVREYEQEKAADTARNAVTDITAT